MGKRSKRPKIPSSRSLVQPAKGTDTEKSTGKVSPRIIDVTEKYLEAGVTGFGIIGAVTPESWLREHGYIKGKKESDS
jgi:hypothetical protein